MGLRMGYSPLTNFRCAANLSLKDQNEALEHGLFEDEVYMPRQLFQDKVPVHRLLEFPNFRCIANSSRTKHLGMGYLKIKFN
jgi:hypothetical protein